MDDLIGDIRQLAQSDPTLLGVVDAENAFIDQLIGEAQGDLQAALKKIDAQHKLALGTDDAARAGFLERVANQLEERVGRIPFDYERFTNRQLQDFARGETRINEDRSTALQRLDEDESLLKEEARLEADEARQLSDESLNERGTLRGGIANRERGDLEGRIRRREQEITRAAGRDRLDINRGGTRGLEDLTTGRDRSLEDITTLARRGAIDQTQATQFGREDANRTFDARKRALDRERKRLLANAPAQASFINSFKKGIG